MPALTRVWPDAVWLPFLQLLQHRTLTWELTRRDIYDRYVGQVFGALWAIGHPLITVSVYILIFKFVFGVRVATPDAQIDYAVYLLSGLLPWLTYQEAMNKGTAALVSNANLVKQVVFPIEVLPTKCALASWTTQIVGTVILIVYVVCTTGQVPATLLLLPLLWLCQCLGMIGLAMILSMVGAYLRDVKEFVVVFGVLGMYVAPIAYAPESVPGLVRPLLYANPFSYMVWCYQDALCFGTFAHWWAWPVFIGLSLTAFFVGFFAFTKAKDYVGNVV
jgi:lipopolysaccharide transport system permease protein